MCGMLPPDRALSRVSADEYMSVVMVAAFREAEIETHWCCRCGTRFIGEL